MKRWLNDLDLRYTSNYYDTFLVEKLTIAIRAFAQATPPLKFEK